jgi:hypothetical protein
MAGVTGTPPRKLFRRRFQFPASVLSLPTLNPLDESAARFARQTRIRSRWRSRNSFANTGSAMRI